MAYRPVIGLTISGMVLAACATAADPCAAARGSAADRNMWVNVLAGNYSACEAEMRTDLANARARAAAWESEAARLERRAAETDGQAAAAARRAAAASQALSEAIAERDRLATERGASEERLRELQRREAALERELSGVAAQDGQVSQIQIAQIEDDIAALRDEIRALEEAA
ncbi:MAG: hypothetical protein AAFS07_11400 [Pseudomonadota bacterium]